MQQETWCRPATWRRCSLVPLGHRMTSGVRVSLPLCIQGVPRSRQGFVHVILAWPRLTKVVMMCNICLQTYLVSNLSALLTRADVGIYTMRHAAALKGFSMQGKQQDACVAMPGGCIRVLALPREPV